MNFEKKLRNNSIDVKRRKTNNYNYIIIKIIKIKNIQENNEFIETASHISVFFKC